MSEAYVSGEALNSVYNYVKKKQGEARQTEIRNLVDIKTKSGIIYNLGVIMDTEWYDTEDFLTLLNVIDGTLPMSDLRGIRIMHGRERDIGIYTGSEGMNGNMKKFVTENGMGMIISKSPEIINKYILDVKMKVYHMHPKVSDITVIYNGDKKTMMHYLSGVYEGINKVKKAGASIEPKTDDFGFTITVVNP